MSLIDPEARRLFHLLPLRYIQAVADLELPPAERPIQVTQLPHQTRTLIALTAQSGRRLALMRYTTIGGWIVEIAQPDMLEQVIDALAELQPRLTCRTQKEDPD